MHRVAIGIPSYGDQPADWWLPLMREVAELHNQGIELVDIHQAGSMMTDWNRNKIARLFLESKADWLFWVDADNVNPGGTLARLLAAASPVNRTLVSALYYSRDDVPRPHMYRKAENGMYRPITDWVRGEIIRADAAGMNAVLSHRQVYEDIDRNYVLLREAVTGIGISVHKDDVIGDVFDAAADENDGKVVNGVYYRRVYWQREGAEIPFFVLGYGRTEDIDFFERAARVGHPLWVDTSVECGHLRWEMVTGRQFREQRARTPSR